MTAIPFTLIIIAGFSLIIASFEMAVERSQRANSRRQNFRRTVLG